MQVRVLRLLDYVDVELTGHLDVEQLLELIGKLGNLTQDSEDKRLLFDLTGLEGEVHLISQLRVGEHIARCLSHLSRVASVVTPQRLTRISEKVARARGVQLQIFDSKDAAISWLRDSSPEPAGSQVGDPTPMDPARAAIWETLRHLFPLHAQAIQLPNGTLAISWALDNQPGSAFQMATPITVRLEPGLEESLAAAASGEERRRIALQHEAVFRAGLMGYDPYTAVPKARVIILG